MANISEATGTIELKGHKESITAMLHLIDEVASNWPYHTMRLDDTPVDVLLLDQDQDDCTIVIDFDGAGRWIYEANVKSLYPTLIDAYQEKSLNTQQEKWLEQLNKNPIKLTFDYADMEPGVCVLYQQKIEVTWEKDFDIRHTPYDKTPTITNVISETNYTYNAENIDKLFDVEFYDGSGYSLKLIIDEMGLNEMSHIIELELDNISLTSDQTDHLVESFDKLNSDNKNMRYYSMDEWLDDEKNAERLKTVLLSELTHK